jgi:hypothetical protein
VSAANRVGVNVDNVKAFGALPLFKRPYLPTIRSTCFLVVLLRRFIGLPLFKSGDSLLRLHLQAQAALDAVGHKALAAETSQAA